MSAIASILTGLHCPEKSNPYESRPLDSKQLEQLLAATEASKTDTIHSSAVRDNAAYADPVILCIGTDRIVGDSLGPLTGSLLTKCAGNSLAIYGTLEAPVHACNLADTLLQIKKEHPNSAVIAVDASLGCHYKVGSVLIRSGSIRPGMGVKKDLPAVGDISITGIAGTQNSRPYLVLQTVRLSLIMSMAEQICECILSVCR